MLKIVSIDVRGEGVGLHEDEEGERQKKDDARRDIEKVRLFGKAAEEGKSFWERGMKRGRIFAKLSSGKERGVVLCLR